MTAPTELAAEFNLDEMLLLQRLLHVGQFPIVLEVMAPPDYFDGGAAATAAAMESLLDKGVVTGDVVTEPSVAQWIRVLQRPDVELAARIWRPGAHLGISICRRGPLHAVAMRHQDLITIQGLSESSEILAMHQILAPIMGALGSAPAAQFEPINLLADVGRQIDQNVAKGADYYNELLAAGVPEPSTRLITDALADRDQVWRAEIAAIEQAPGKAIHAQAGVGVFDTPLGRIVASPQIDLDGQLWSTFAPGTNDRLVTAVQRITDMLPSGGWFEAVRH